MSMTFVQRLFTGLLSRHAAEIEEHSRQWMLRCTNCGFERSIWDMGGVKWRARGNSRNYMRCINCGSRNWHQMYRKVVDSSRNEDGNDARHQDNR